MNFLLGRPIFRGELLVLGRVDITHPEETETHPELTASEATNRLGISMILINYSQPPFHIHLVKEHLPDSPTKIPKMHVFSCFFLHEALKVYTFDKQHFSWEPKGIPPMPRKPPRNSRP